MNTQVDTNPKMELTLWFIQSFNERANWTGRYLITGWDKESVVDELLENLGSNWEVKHVFPVCKTADQINMEI